MRPRLELQDHLGLLHDDTVEFHAYPYDVGAEAACLISRSRIRSSGGAVIIGSGGIIFIPNAAIAHVERKKRLNIFIRLEVFCRTHSRDERGKSD